MISVHEVRLDRGTAPSTCGVAFSTRPVTLPVKKLTVHANLYDLVRRLEWVTRWSHKAVLDWVWARIVSNSGHRLDASEDDLATYWDWATSGMQAALDTSLVSRTDRSRRLVRHTSEQAWRRLMARRRSAQAFVQTDHAKMLSEDVIHHIFGMLN